MQKLTFISIREITLIFIWVLFFSSSQVFGQSQTDSIKIKKTLGTNFIQNGKKLRPNQLLEITKVNPEAFKEMEIAKSNYNLGSVFGYTGGFLVGWPIGVSLGGGEPNWVMAGIGAGLIAVSIPFSISYVRHAKSAVGIYNSSLNDTGLKKVDFNLGLTSNGFGIKMTF